MAFAAKLMLVFAMCLFPVKGATSFLPSLSNSTLQVPESPATTQAGTGLKDATSPTYACDLDHVAEARALYQLAVAKGEMRFQQHFATQNLEIAKDLCKEPLKMKCHDYQNRIYQIDPVSKVQPGDYVVYNGRVPESIADLERTQGYQWKGVPEGYVEGINLPMVAQQDYPEVQQEFPKISKTSKFYPLRWRCDITECSPWLRAGENLNVEVINVDGHGNFQLGTRQNVHMVPKKSDGSTLIQPALAISQMVPIKNWLLPGGQSVSQSPKHILQEDYPDGVNGWRTYAGRVDGKHTYAYKAMEPCEQLQTVCENLAAGNATKWPYTRNGQFPHYWKYRTSRDAVYIAREIQTMADKIEATMVKNKDWETLLHRFNLMVNQARDVSAVIRRDFKKFQRITTSKYRTIKPFRGGWHDPEAWLMRSLK